MNIERKMWSDRTTTTRMFENGLHKSKELIPKCIGKLITTLFFAFFFSFRIPKKFFYFLCVKLWKLSKKCWFPISFSLTLECWNNFFWFIALISSFKIVFKYSMYSLAFENMPNVNVTLWIALYIFDRFELK